MADQRSAWLAGLVFLAACGIAHADADTAQACAAKLPKDAQTIFAATLPQLGPGTDLRDVVTTTTRGLAEDNKIDRATARPSAVSPANCLRLAAP